MADQCQRMEWLLELWKKKEEDKKKVLEELVAQFNKYQKKLADVKKRFEKSEEKMTALRQQIEYLTEVITAEPMDIVKEREEQTVWYFLL
uniref:Uncharacterized protein n=1 Tax=Sphaerodactylus townsendi TaxID=933632 RepID=A0ACB8EEL8_9SAUR